MKETLLKEREASKRIVVVPQGKIESCDNDRNIPQERTRIVVTDNEREYDNDRDTPRKETRNVETSKRIVVTPRKRLR